MTPIEQLLSRLAKVKGRNGSWTARCPAHEDRGPSLSIREKEDGRILLHCHAGCDVFQVVHSVGLDLGDLFPPDEKRRDYPVHGLPAVKPAFYASDLLRIISFETLVVAICAYDMSQGKRLAEGDRERLKVSQQRIEEAVKYANV
jgi:hypothetical protein